MMTKNLVDISPADLPAANIKVAFFDIDGTLLGLEGKYSEQTQQQISRLRANGVRTAVASGRPYFAAQFIVNELGLKDPGVFCTGAHIYCPTRQQTLTSSAIPKALAQSLVDHIRQLDIHYELYTENDYFIEKNVCDEIRQVHTTHMRVSPKEANFDECIAQQPVIKMLVAVNQRNKHVVLHDLEQAFNADFYFAYAGIAAYPDWLFVSIIHKAACKEKAFDALLEHYGVEASQVIAFGDAQSDMVFLSRAGVGVAMGNASDEVKACANYVTKPVWEDGVAYALERFCADTTSN